MPFDVHQAARSPGAGCGLSLWKVTSVMTASPGTAGRAFGTVAGSGTRPKPRAPSRGVAPTGTTGVGAGVGRITQARPNVMAAVRMPVTAYRPKFFSVKLGTVIVTASGPVPTMGRHGWADGAKDRPAASVATKYHVNGC